MAELHEALKYLGPAVWSEFPTSEQELRTYITDLFSKAQLIVDSVPVPSPNEVAQEPRAQPANHARSASEVSISSERSAAPPPEHAKLQKDWGKPLKVKANDNPLGMSVYKMSGKDSRGSWFARHSIHEGIGFSKFKKSLQMEFEKSLAESGPPGTGNVRGIGGEERLEQVKTDNACIEVYRLSAQFPGPTAPRDFVTLLITSEDAFTGGGGATKTSATAVNPRHYLVISRPCDHPDTQPRQGMVRGFYESIEFIREVPRKLKSSQSVLDVTSHPQANDKPEQNSADKDKLSKSASVKKDSYDPENNPVEWLMITRSDPGGGIPRFLVERGTPSSICADAVKFVDWACSNDDVAIPQSQSEGDLRPTTSTRRESYQSWRARSVVGVAESEHEANATTEEPEETNAIATGGAEPQTTQNQGIFGAVSSTLLPFTPQVILDRLPGSQPQESAPAGPSQNTEEHIRAADLPNENRSVMSTTSFASAEDHLSSSSEHDGEVASLESQIPQSPTLSKEHSQHEKELTKIKERKQALYDKFAASRAKQEEAHAKQLEKDAGLSSKAIEKHERELKKHEEKYQKELEKLEQKQEKERLKMIEKQRKELEKDDRVRLTRERDEARQEVDLLRKETESLTKIVQELQKENNALAMKLGQSTLSLNDVGSGSRSRGSSLSTKEKRDKVAEAKSPSASLKGP